MKKNKENQTTEQFYDSVHTLGRFTSYLAVAVFFVCGLLICLILDIMPSFSEILVGGFAFFVLMFASGFMEFAAYAPKLGAGSTYLCFITGNIANMKLPSVTAAVEAMDVKEGTEEHEIISIIATSVASLFMILLITIVVLFSGVITPFLTWEPIQPAFDNILPIIYGVLCFGAFVKLPKVLAPTFLLVCVFSLLLPDSIRAIAMIFISVGIAIGMARLFYKKGWQNPID